MNADRIEDIEIDHITFARVKIKMYSFCRWYSSVIYNSATPTPSLNQLLRDLTDTQHQSAHRLQVHNRLPQYQLQYQNEKFDLEQYNNCNTHSEIRCKITGNNHNKTKIQSHNDWARSLRACFEKKEMMLYFTIDFVWISFCVKFVIDSSTDSVEHCEYPRHILIQHLQIIYYRFADLVLTT